MKKILKLLLIVIIFMSLFGCNSKSNSDNSNDDRELMNSQMIEDLSKTKKIMIEKVNTEEILKTITDENEIKKVLSVISHAGKKFEGEETFAQLSSWKLYMYEDDNKLLATIDVWNDGWIGFDNEKEYLLSDDQNLLMEVIEN